MSLRNLATTLSIAACLGAAQLAPAQNIPTPLSVIGNDPGADFFLASYDQSIEYFRALDRASDRLQLVNVGETSHGLDWYMAVISSPENLANFDRHTETSRRLAAARGIDDAEARRLAASSPVIVHIDGGLHATEVAHSQHTIQLAYKLCAAQGDPEIDAILDGVIFLLWFSINPDGQNMVSEWYHRNLGTPFETSGLPTLYQKYVGHDNNRDGYMNNMIESQVVTRWTLQFSPHVFYNHHQTAPFPARIWIPPFAEPVSRNPDPRVWRWVNQFGTSMARYLDEHGMPGAMHRGTGFDDWYPGFIDHVNSFRNTISFLTETALFTYATPRFYSVNDFPANKRDLRSEVMYASPWEGGWWRIGDAVDYMIGASMAVLDTAAKYRESLIYNRYEIGRDTIAHFTENPPYAYIVSADQRDLPTAALLMNKMIENGVEVHRAVRPLAANGVTYPEGSWVIAMDQAFARLAKELFEIQEYPDLRQSPGGDPDNPYDVAGWTLPLQMGVDSIEVLQPLSDDFRAALRIIETAEVSGGATGRGDAFTFSRAPNNAAKVINEVLASGGAIHFSGDDATASGLSRNAMNAIAGRHGIEAVAADAVEGDAVTAPRVALYQPYSPSIDEGWTRWLLERFGFNPITLHNDEVRAGALADRYDAIIFADIRGGQIMNGRAKGTVPGEFTGGIGDLGADNLREFVSGGGTVLGFNNGGTGFLIGLLDLPVTNAVAGLRGNEFFGSGSILGVETRAEGHAILAGMPARPNIMFDRSPAFETGRGFRGRVLLGFHDERNPLKSGYLLGPEKLAGKAALIEARHGEGRAILFGFKPQWRGQSHGTFKLIFNALYASAMDGADSTEPDSPAESLATRWTNIREGVHADLADLIELNQTMHDAEAGDREAATKKLDDAIARFREDRIGALKLFGESVENPAEDDFKRYITQLRTALIDLRANDLTVVDYELDDALTAYRLTPLERAISGALSGS